MYERIIGSISMALGAYVIIGFVDWLKTPSPWTKAETEYTACLEVVLKHSSKDPGIANQLCADRKK